MKIEAGQLGGAIGAALMPVAQDMMPGIISGLEEMIDDIRRNKTEIEEFAAAVGTLAKAFGDLALLAGKGVNKASDLVKGSGPEQISQEAIGTAGILGGVVTGNVPLVSGGMLMLGNGMYQGMRNGLDKRTFDQETKTIDPNNKMDEKYMQSLVPGAGQYSSLAGTKYFKDILKKNSDASLS